MVNGSNYSHLVLDDWLWLKRQKKNERSLGVCVRKTRIRLQDRIGRFCISQEGGSHLLLICWGVYLPVHLASCQVGSGEIRSLSAILRLLNKTRSEGGQKQFLKKRGSPSRINPCLSHAKTQKDFSLMHFPCWMKAMRASDFVKCCTQFLKIFTLYYKKQI